MKMWTFKRRKFKIGTGLVIIQSFWNFACDETVVKIIEKNVDDKFTSLHHVRHHRSTTGFFLLDWALTWLGSFHLQKYSRSSLIRRCRQTRFNKSTKCTLKKKHKNKINIYWKLSGWGGVNQCWFFSRYHLCIYI